MVLQKTVIPRTRFPNHKTVESEGSTHGVFYTTAGGSTVENEGEKTLRMSTSDGGQLKKVTFQVATVNEALESVSKMVRNGNRVVFDTSGSYIENQMTKDMMWLRERDGVHVMDMMAAPPGGNRLMGGGECTKGTNRGTWNVGQRRGSCTRWMMTRRYGDRQRGDWR